MTHLNQTGKLTARSNDGQFQELNLTHWLAVKNARVQKGLPVMCEIPTDTQYLEGEMYANKFTNRLFKLTKMQESWWGGRYLQGRLVSQDGFSIDVVLHNRSSVHPVICHEEAAFLASYERYQPV